MNFTEKHHSLQLCLNTMGKRALEIGFMLSSTNTNGKQFCNKRKLHSDQELKLYNSPNKTVEENDFRSYFQL